MIKKGRIYKCILDTTVAISKDECITFCEGVNYKAPEDDTLTTDLNSGINIPITPDIGDRCFREEMVNHPAHYQGNIECIDVVRDIPFWKGNAIKYLWRAGIKQEFGKSDITKEIEDLEKAKWYIQDRINQLKQIE